MPGCTDLGTYEDIGRFVQPAALMVRAGKELVERLPEAKRPVSGDM